tara:strand:+ start:73 stop:417 length:345 start_codon:yes stop_codon:yes gene_type:complete
MKDHYDDINVIHYNDFGIAFNWKQNTFSTKNKIQLVFKDTGILLSKSEVLSFKSDIEYVMCNGCNCKEKCKNLIPSPCEYISFSMSDSELISLNDLLAGVCFNIELTEILENII